MTAEPQQQPKARAGALRPARRAPRWVMPAVKTALVAADALAAVAAFVAAYALREGGGILVRFNFAEGFVWDPRFEPYGALLWLLVPIRVLTLRYCDLYRLRGEFSYLDDCARVLKAAAVGTLLIVAAAFLYRGGYEFRTFSYSRAVFLYDFLLALAAYTALRLAVRAGQSAFRRRGVNLIPTLVVGRGPEAALYVRETRGRRELGYRVIGVVETGAGVVAGGAGDETFEGAPVVCGLTGLAEAVRETGAEEVIITDPRVPGDLLFDVMMRTGRRRGVEFRIAPSLFNSLPRKTRIDRIGAQPFVTLFREPLTRGARLVKRAADVTVALAGLVLLAPFWAFVALLVKLDSRGPVLYRQTRVGMDGRPFVLYKFRTMREDSDDSAHREYQRRYINGGDGAGGGGGGTRTVYKLRPDPRVTRVGRWLRRWGGDELPQLLNVLRGEMSAVGPRPPIPYEVEIYRPWQRRRLDTKPGLTGLWQVSKRDGLSFDEMVRLDLYYIENWSLRLDLSILLRTPAAMFRGDGAD